MENPTHGKQSRSHQSTSASDLGHILNDVRTLSVNGHVRRRQRTNFADVQTKTCQRLEETAATA